MTKKEDFNKLLAAALMGFYGESSSTQIDFTELDGFKVSTANTIDCGLETAIGDANDCHIVEHYSSEEEARKGHAKWVKFLQDGNREITDVGYGDAIPPEKRILVPIFNPSLN